mmetsp:Transcript_47111/g.119232  ORF Transcript_47111/g.119232 Transcript_47111/m.119232 type:complete len:215 (+) Transcript_47111:711-1355(+)
MHGGTSQALASSPVGGLPSGYSSCMPATSAAHPSANHPYSTCNSSTSVWLAFASPPEARRKPGALATTSICSSLESTTCRRSSHALLSPPANSTASELFFSAMLLMGHCRPCRLKKEKKSPTSATISRVLRACVGASRYLATSMVLPRSVSCGSFIAVRGPSMVVLAERDIRWRMCSNAFSRVYSGSTISSSLSFNDATCCESGRMPRVGWLKA